MKVKVYKSLEQTGMPEEFWPLGQKWLDRGDGVAVYENQELGHMGYGHRQFCSYGSKAAQLECSFPPARMPDMTNQINWRYWLVGVMRTGMTGDYVEVEIPTRKEEIL